MSILSWQDLVKYFAEMLVVVLGILIAFQVDEWREGLREDRELDASLVRLREETMENSRRCANGLRRLARRVLATQTVHKALQLGRLVNAEVELFNEGLVKMGNFWNVTISTSATNEMISTGLLREMDNPDLRAAIGKVPDEFQRLSDFTAIFRLENGVLIDELAGIVTYTYTGEYLPADQIDKSKQEKQYTKVVQPRYGRRRRRIRPRGLCPLGVRVGIGIDGRGRVALI